MELGKVPANLISILSLCLSDQILARENVKKPAAIAKVVPFREFINRCNAPWS